MEEILLNLIASFMLTIAIMYTWYKCLYIKLDVKVIVLIVTFMTVITTILNTFVPNPIRLLLTFLLLTITCYYFVIKNLKLSIILAILLEIIIGLSEFLYVIFISLLYNDDLKNLMNNSFIYIGLNVFIILISFLINKIGLPRNVFKILQKSYDEIKSNEVLVSSIMIIAIIIISTTLTYMKLSLPIVVVVNIITAGLFIGLVVMSSKVKANYNRISSKYETSISSLKEYEIMIDKFRVSTHENKNEFYTIRNMLKEENNDEKVIKYIDKLIDNKIKDSDKIMKKTAKIPEGGLRATIYSKLCLMDKLKIKYKLNISRDVRTTDLINLDEDIILKICKILGVFLDNAIEAVKHLKKKEIFIEIYSLNNYLCIDITNNFKGNLDLDKISNTKYTTKGDGHGYGLTLVNKLLEEESNKLKNEKSINRDTFTQTLKIKM